MTGGLYDDVNYGLSRKDRCFQVKKHLLFGIIELALVGTTVALILNFNPTNDFAFITTNIDDSFRLKVIVWLAGYGALYVILVIRRLIFVCQWLYMADPRYVQSQWHCLTFVFLNGFEFGWFIYGNTIFFADQVYENSDDQKLYLYMLGILIYGYINSLVYFFALCGICLIIATVYLGGFLNKKDHREYNQQLNERKEKLAHINQQNNNRLYTINMKDYYEDQRTK